jgi:hypothetical protein
MEEGDMGHVTFLRDIRNAYTIYLKNLKEGFRFENCV